jgi:hypothetical protein
MYNQLTSYFVVKSNDHSVQHYALAAAARSQ